MARDAILEGMTQDDIELLAAENARILKNPDLRMDALRLRKKANPTAVIPELDIPDRVAAEGVKEREAREQLESRIRESEARERIRDERDKLRGQGFSDTEITGIENEMVEAKKNGTLLTYESASRYFRAMNTMAQPTPSAYATSMTNEMPGDALKAMKEGGTNGLKKFTRDRAAKALDDINAGRIKLH